MKQTLSKLPNYVARFGALQGTRLAFDIERNLPRRSTERRAYRVPDFEHPVWLRETVSDHAIFWQCLVLQQYSVDRFAHCTKLDAAYSASLRAGRQPVIIDCGANIGLSCIWFARRFPQARIVAVEPESANLEMLKLNTSYLGERVVIANGGVWPRSGYLRIVNPDAGSAAFRVEPCASTESGSMRAYSIPELRVLGGGGDLLIVKIDIEGAQRHLFASDTDWVGETHLVTLELDDWLLPWTGSSRSFFSCLSRWPFEYLLGGESVFCFRDWESA